MAILDFFGKKVVGAFNGFEWFSVLKAEKD